MAPSNLSVRHDGEQAGVAAVSRAAQDRDLAQRCHAGDLTAFEELYRRHAQRLYGVAWRMLGNAADAEDLLQDVFLLAYRKLDGFRGEAALGTWLYRLAVNQCLDRLRSRAARMNRRTDAFEESGAALPPAPDAARRLAGRLDLERAIGQLPEGCRAAFLLHDVEGFEHREVAEILEIAEGTSKSQVHKARQKLRVLLRDG